VKYFVEKHPTTSYFVLAFMISWTGIILVIDGGAIPATPEEAQRLFAPVYLAMLLGPSVAGLVVTSIAGGREGLAAFRSRLFTWRVPGRWYAIALLTAPLALGASLLALRLFSPQFVPGVITGSTGGPVAAASRSSFLLMALLVGIGAGFFEELGWTGVAIPRVRGQRGLLRTGLLVGIAWGGWHLLAVYWGSADAFGTVPVPLYLAVSLFSILVPYRVLMAWVYERTQSLFIAILMHASLTTSSILLGPAVGGRALMAHDLVVAGLLWVIVAFRVRSERTARRA
jgi:membrane protease YdiL (CAAX protease family)